MDKKITVIIPIYNMGRYLEECLDSIVNQTIDGVEVIAVNDGSTDNSLEILNRYSEKYPNIMVHSQENQGQASAKNYGILHAKGKYIIFMDPDDYYPDDKCLENLYNCAEKQQALICAGIILHNSNGTITIREPEHIEKYYHNQYVEVLDYDNIYNHTRYLFNREHIISNNILFPLYRRYEDQPFTVKALALAGKFFASNVSMYVYRIGHKKVKYSLAVCKDMISGVRDTINLCRQYGLDKMYEKCLKNITKTYIVQFYKYTYNGNKELDNLIEEFNNMMIEWKGNEYQPFTREYVIDYRNKSLEYYSFITGIMKSGKPIILYGAGKRAEVFLDICNKNHENILGFAVSKMTGEESYHGIKVQNIRQYDIEDLRKNASVFVTTSLTYRKEIEDVLNEMGFKHIIYPEISMLRLADDIINNN